VIENKIKMTDPSGRRRKKRKSTKVGFGEKYRTLLIGAFLILTGIGSYMYSFDYRPDFSTIFDLSRLTVLINLWPFFIVIVGFGFIIYDYLKNSSKQKYK